MRFTTKSSLFYGNPQSSRGSCCKKKRDEGMRAKKKKAGIENSGCVKCKGKKSKGAREKKRGSESRIL